MSQDKNDQLFGHTHPEHDPKMDFSIYPEAIGDPRAPTYPKGHPKYVDMGSIAVEATDASQTNSTKESDNKEHVSAN